MAGIWYDKGGAPTAARSLRNICSNQWPTPLRYLLPSSHRLVDAQKHTPPRFFSLLPQPPGTSTNTLLPSMLPTRHYPPNLISFPHTITTTIAVPRQVIHISYSLAKISSSSLSTPPTTTTLHWFFNLLILFLLFITRYVWFLCFLFNVLLMFFVLFLRPCTRTSGVWICSSVVSPEIYLY